MTIVHTRSIAHWLTRGKRLALSAALASAFLVGPLSGSAHAMSRRCEVLKNYMDNTYYDTWMWRAASVEYMNYC
jgi:hypothetical protein